jgi:MFS transporter, putative metabolite:H+ symporter
VTSAGPQDDGAASGEPPTVGPQAAPAAGSQHEKATSSRAVTLAVVVAALGYFVDIYDLILFSIIRVRSLEALGLSGAAITNEGIWLINMQMSGMLVGGIVWGVLGDKRGRLSVLFGSILMYSLANIANGFVNDLTTYAVLRFVAGVGLAGELGAGITLVSESMHKDSRGYGTMIVATIGILGAIAAVLVADLFTWRVSYFVGGGLGLALLALRIGVVESGMYKQLARSAATRGNFFQLFSPASRARRYVAVILIAVPIWYVVAILVSLAPELARAMGMREIPTAGRAIMFCYIGLAAGDLASGALSQHLKSRRKVVYGFLVSTAVCIAAYFGVGHATLGAFYVVCGLLGFSTGYWAVFVTIASEQFGTNLRATATTSAPNFVRGAVVLLTSAFKALTPHVGAQMSAIAVGAVAMVLAFFALRSLEETYGKDLDFVES